jgi:PTH1 family peptidyl-tRNA hydrolase
MIELVAFLGNPGPGYSRNRHNAGRLLAERLPFYGELCWQKKYKGLYAALDGGRLPAAASALLSAGSAAASVRTAAGSPAAASSAVPARRPPRPPPSLPRRL